MLCRFESPVYDKGTPPELRTQRMILGKRTGQFELRECDIGYLVAAGDILNLAGSGNLKNRITYHAAVDESGLFVSEGPLNGSTFDVSSNLSVMRQHMESMIFSTISYSYSQIGKSFYPSSLAYAIMRQRPQSGSFHEVVPSEYRDFDMATFDAQHQQVAADLQSYVACGTTVYRSVPKPFIGVQVNDAGVVSIGGYATSAEEFAQQTNPVRIFGFDEIVEAKDFAKRLANSSDTGCPELNSTAEIERSEYFHFDATSWQFKLMADLLAKNFLAEAYKLKLLNVIFSVDLQELQLIRIIQEVANDPNWMNRLDALELAINSCLDYKRTDGSNPFAPENKRSFSLCLELWQDRIVDANQGLPGNRINFL